MSDVFSDDNERMHSVFFLNRQFTSENASLLNTVFVNLFNHGGFDISCTHMYQVRVSANGIINSMLGWHNADLKGCWES